MLAVAIACGMPAAERRELVVAQPGRRAPAAGSSRCRPSRSTGGRRQPASGRSRRRSSSSTTPRICWPCCSVQGAWKAILLRGRGAGPGQQLQQPRASRRRSLRSRPASVRRCARLVAHSRDRRAAGGRIRSRSRRSRDAVMTMASTPCSTCGHQASISAPRIGAAALLVVEVKAHRAAAAGCAVPRRVRCRDGRARAPRRALMSGASAGCTQPSSTSMRRACRAGGQDAARAPSPAPWPPGFDGSSGRTTAPAAAAGANSQGRGSASFSARRCSVSAAARGTRCFHDGAADVEQAAVLHAGRAGGFAGAAGQAAVEMQLRLGGGRLAFQHLLDQVDAAARTVELVAEQLVGRTGGGAEAAVHAFAQDGVGFAALRRVLDEVGEIGLHRFSRIPGEDARCAGQRLQRAPSLAAPQPSGYRRPGLRMPPGRTPASGCGGAPAAPAATGGTRRRAGRRRGTAWHGRPPPATASRTTRGLGVALQPAQAPPHSIELGTGQFERAGASTAATTATAGRCIAEKAEPLFAHCRPEFVRLRRPPRRPVAARAASTAACAPDRRTISSSSCQQVAEIGSGWPAQRSSSQAPAPGASRTAASPPPRASGSTLSDTSRINAQRAQRTRHQARDVVAGDVLHHLAAEASALGRGRRGSSRRARSRAPRRRWRGAGRTVPRRRSRRPSPPAPKCGGSKASIWPPAQRAPLRSRRAACRSAR